MRRMRTLARRAWVGPLAALFFTTGIAAPLMESLPGSDGPVVESQHEPGECVPGHDHTLCILINAGSVLPAPAPTGHATHVSEASPVATRAATRGGLALPEGHPPRAPPFI